MNDIPQDPFMLLSWVNMKLRDQYDSLDQLTGDLQPDKEELTHRLSEAGFEYMPGINQFR